MSRASTALGRRRYKPRATGYSRGRRGTRGRNWALLIVGTTLPILALLATAAIWLDALPAALPFVGPSGGSPVTIGSIPAGAVVRIDGRQRGRTPLALALRPGRHEVAVGGEATAPQIAEVIVPVPTGDTPPAPQALDFALWSSAPAVTPLHPPLPGAAIDDALFTDDGRVLVTVTLPGSDERQIWWTDGAGLAQRLGPPGVRGPIAPSPDGRRLAWLAAPPALPKTSSTPPARFTEVWIGPSGSNRATDGAAVLAWEIPATGSGVSGDADRLADVAWAPDGRTLILTVAREVGGRAHSRLLGLPLGERGATAPPVELLAIVGEPLPHSWAWRSDGMQGALLIAVEDRLALVALGFDPTAPYVRYLDDLPARPAPPRRSPVAWQPGGRGLVYLTAPRDPKVPVVLGIAPVDGRAVRLLETGNGLFPDWREGGGAQGTLITLYPGRDGLSLRATDPAAGLTANGPVLPLPRGGTPVAVNWERGGARAIVALDVPEWGSARVAYYLIDWR